MTTAINDESIKELYELTKVVELVHLYGDEDRVFRIEAMHNLKTGSYCAHVYIQEQSTLQPTYPQKNGKSTAEPSDHSLWCTFHIGWTNCPSSESAIKQAISFIAGK